MWERQLVKNNPRRTTQEEQQHEKQCKEQCKRSNMKKVT
jgi:hypothetical protein